ncbi:MAG: hypothetical protein CR972_03875 [Candidatus Moraniibacteriota bacterium]|nr:MAG: hypothetical protein CR972_03875 [Candidatus Moranbacteria bacterium]
MIEILFSIFVVILCVWIIYTVLFLAPWLPTFSRDMKRIVEIANLDEGDVFCELGSGDGRVSFYVSEKSPQAKIIGVEISYILHSIASVKKMFSHAKNITFKREDIYRTNLSDVDVIYVFATSRSANRLARYLQKSVKKGSRIISYNFQLPFESKVATEKKVKEKKRTWYYMCMIWLDK